MSNGSGPGPGPGPIPQRWLDCPRKSDGLIQDIFLAFKTPLSSKFDDQVPAANRFTPSMLLLSLKSYKIDLGLWIDLTNTNRFYDAKEVGAYCKHVKLSCRGHSEAPTKESVQAFIKVVANFRSKCPTKAIGVHCTHGFNRTGYMICSYLVEQEGISCDLAVQLFAKARSVWWYPLQLFAKARSVWWYPLQLFAKARSVWWYPLQLFAKARSVWWYPLQLFAKARMPGIYKQDYINQLFSIYGDEEDAPTAPSLPTWHTESDDSPAGGSSSGGGGRRNGRGVPTFMEGVQNVHPVTNSNDLTAVRKKMQRLCGYKSNGFPGCQPVSMSRSNITLLKDMYYVSWKADGTRYMMLIDDKGAVYLADRDNNIFHAPNVSFKDKDDPNVNLKDTLVDGEMVIDIEPKSKKKLPRYLIYDSICVRGKDVRDDTFWLRWERINTDIIKPRNYAISMGKIHKMQEPFSVRRKDFWEATACNTKKLLSDSFKQKLLHEPDGLIFQPDQRSYVCGRCDNVLKWKPPSHNSVDFKLKVIKQGGEGLLPTTIGQLFLGGLDVHFSEIKFKNMKEYNNKIIECSVDEKGQWVFMRERTDKSFPNSFKTAEAVMQTIREPVTEDFLLGFIANHGYRKPDNVLMPPPMAGVRPPLPGHQSRPQFSNNNHQFSTSHSNNHQFSSGHDNHSQFSTDHDNNRQFSASHTNNHQFSSGHSNDGQSSRPSNGMSVDNIASSSREHRPHHRVPSTSATRPSSSSTDHRLRMPPDTDEDDDDVESLMPRDWHGPLATSPTLEFDCYDTRDRDQGGDNDFDDSNSDDELLPTKRRRFS
ncbi:mRNA capping enzyme catalytic domain [Trinorchestia longiramus]|nr:mRNA capping enzyme catalytic domain [Trinorchestia longiramus]